MPTSKQNIESGAAQIGVRMTISTPEEFSHCMNCGAVTEWVDETLGTIIGIDKEKFGIQFDLGEAFECACCGHKWNNVWSYEPGYAPKAPEPPKCVGIMPITKAKPEITIQINTNGGAKIDGDLNYSGELVMRDNVVHNHYHI